MAVGVGAGLLVDAPLGRLWVTAAWPIAEPFGGGMQFHLGSGAAF
jgi:hypothetical protein